MNKLLIGLGLFGAYVLLKSPEASAQPAPTPKPSAPPKPVAPAPPVQKPAVSVVAHPNWDLPDSMLVGVPAALVRNIDSAYGSRDPIALSVYVPQLQKAGRADLASLVTSDIQTMSHP